MVLCLLSNFICAMISEAWWNTGFGN
jgi:hypothetical protein